MGTTTVFLNDDGQYEQSVDYGDDYKEDIIAYTNHSGAGDVCPHCGGNLIGDGFTMVLHCENADLPLGIEPDAGPVYCKEEGD